MSFDVLGLTPELIRAVADEGYTQPTPIQHQAIPIVLTGRDLLATAQTGTGKTAAFVLPMLQRLHSTADHSPRDDRSQRHRRPIRALVLAPTRELALQVEASVRTYGARHPIRSVAIYGGVGFEPQVRAIRAGAQIVVATPGRLLDHVGQRTIDLSQVEILVLDEADRMLDMGFVRDIRRIIALLPPRRQNLMFSATFSDEIRMLAADFLDQPASVDVAPKGTAAELVEQVAIPVDRARKRELLTHLVQSGRIEQALVFTRTKHGANRLADLLVRDGISAAAIHGNKSQGQRIRALDDFKRGRTAILVATDIAARGIDIDALPHVINYEMPLVAEDYVHRIGRTGRAGIGGQSMSLVSAEESPLLDNVERHLRRPIETEVVPGFEPTRTMRAEPVRRSATGARQPLGGRGYPPHRSTTTHDRTGSGRNRRPGGVPVGNRPPEPARHSANARAGIADPRPPVALPGERLARSAGGHGADQPVTHADHRAPHGQDPWAHAPKRARNRQRSRRRAS